MSNSIPTTTLIVRIQSELESLVTRKGTFDPKKHPYLLSLLGGGYTKRHARQTHAVYLLTEHIATLRGTFAFHTGFRPSVEQLQEALLLLFIDPFQRGVMERQDDIIINVFEMEGELGWSRETFKRKQLPLLLRHFARHLALQPLPLLSNGHVDAVLADLEFSPGDDKEDDESI